MLPILLVLISLPISALLLSHNPRTRNILQVTLSGQRKLHFSPTQIARLDILVLVLCILLKYTIQIIRRGPTLQLASNGRDIAIPNSHLVAPIVVGKMEVDKFNHAVKHAAGRLPHVHSPFLIAPITTPLMLILLASFGCPFSPLGAVNTGNRFEFVDVEACRRITSQSQLYARAHMGGDGLAGRRVKRGVEFDVIIEVESRALASSSLSSSNSAKLIFRQVVGILVYLSPSIKPRWQGETKPASTLPTKIFSTICHHVALELQAPVQWAAVSKDYNPIHMSSMAARLFGFPGVVAHGNHIVAQLIELLQDEQATHELAQWSWESRGSFFMEVAFKRPVVLPSTLTTKYEVQHTKTPAGYGGFEMVRDGKVYIQGRFGGL